MINYELLERIDLSSEDIYVFAAFIKPGKHVFVVQSQNKEYNLVKTIAPLREEDPPVCKISNLFLLQRRQEQQAQGG